MKIKFYLSALSLLSLVSVGCVEEPQNPTKPEGDIVWVGNGLSGSQDLKWAFNQGFVVDLKKSDGVVYTMSLGADGVHEVVTNTKDEAVLVRLDWLTKGENDEEIVKLQVHKTAEQKPCRHYESKEDGILVCRQDLENLSIHPDFAPEFLADGSVLYVNDSRDLHLKAEAGDRLLEASIGSYLLDGSQRLFVKNQFSSSWHLIDWNSTSNNEPVVTENDFVTKASHYSFEFTAFRVFLGEQKEIIVLMLGDMPGLYKLQAESNAFDLVQAWPESLDLIEDATDQRLEGNPLVLKALDRSLKQPSESLYQITESGIVLVVEEATSTPINEPALVENTSLSSAISTMAVQSNESSLLYMDEVDGRKSVQFCDRQMSDSVTEESMTFGSNRQDESLAMSCQPVLIEDDFLVEEVVLLDRGHFLAIGRLENQEPSELEIDPTTASDFSADPIVAADSTTEAVESRQSVIVYSVERAKRGFELKVVSVYDLPDNMLGFRYVELSKNVELIPDESRAPEETPSAPSEDRKPSSENPKEELKTGNQSQHLPR
ncbi:MAG: hypothetical protein COV44_04880 [Deltaproteobacteria bacterium CG11_big_fil_rev_8_21_14_0_20_45_16]|nr:MAG: hypothetical protein COV44_04880 [Deltaproteobacteria bacterium CG11_big_fil_rev_8_21_14_0_20_45_16]